MIDNLDLFTDYEDFSVNFIDELNVTFDPYLFHWFDQVISICGFETKNRTQTTRIFCGLCDSHIFLLPNSSHLLLCT